MARQQGEHCLAPVGGPYVADARRLSTHGQSDEWLLTTGNGGFAFGTPSGIPGRQYHGLLNAASNPPVGRIATVSSVEETLSCPGATHDLACYRFASGSVGPGDQAALVSFTKDRASATWVYQVPGVRLTKSLHMGWRRNTAALRYTVEAESPVKLRLRPRVVLRDFHHTLQDLKADRFKAERTESGVRVIAEGQAVILACDTGRYADDPDVTDPVDFAISRAREGKEAFGEPLWSPGVFEVDCAAGATRHTLAFALHPEEPDLGLPDRREREEHLERVGEGAAGALGGGDLARSLRPLVDAADDYLVTRRVSGRELMTVIAGYPWFADWGRDTMICLPGLMLTCGRVQEARSCLETFASFVSEGMVPNRFDDEDDTKAHYNTVDASLWYLQAVRAYAKASGQALKADGVLLDAAKQVVAGYEHGTRYGIGLDPIDGLIVAGDASTQLTWMDAWRDGVSFTPRYGKCVEINALWCNGLRAVAELLTQEEPGLSAELRQKADRAAQSFSAAFVRPDGLGLYDCLRPAEGGGWTPVDEIRPNQLFAVSLPDTPLEREHMKSVVDVCRARLLTPEGLRTLAPEDPNYRGRFKGDMTARDAAYHNGTVWPWLLGPYCEAVLRAGDFSQAAKDEAFGAVSSLLAHLTSGCLGQLTEVYDGDEPRAQEGCTAQAWSIAEALRIAALLAAPAA